MGNLKEQGENNEMLEEMTDKKKLTKFQKKRLPEILAVFGKHNFYANGLTPLELRTTLEDMGPTYVKIGQIMSSRVDMLPEAYCKELGQLRSNVKPLDPALARQVIEEETGKKIEEIYSEFRDEPLGSASIGQVHYAVLKDGTQVVTKVQRPKIADMMREDLVLLRKLASLLSAVSDSDEEGSVDLQEVIDELAAVTEEELDFRVEAENTKFFKENCLEEDSKILCPTIIDELTTERIMTMTYVDGYSVNKKDKLIEDGVDLDELGRILVDSYMHQVFDVGTFHADPHQGNIMVSHGTPYWIDFGMMGHISEENINMIQNIVLSLISGDLEELTDGVMALGTTSPKTNRMHLSDDLDMLMKKYMSVTTLGEIDMSTLLGELTDLSSANSVKLPGEYTMLARGIATLEGVVEELCPDLDVFTFVTDKMKERMKNSFDLKEAILSAGKDSIAATKKVSKVPLLLSDALNSLVKGRLKVNMEMTGYDELVDKFGNMFKNGALILAACFLFLGSCILTLGACLLKSSDMVSSNLILIPLISIFGLLFSIALAIYAIRRINKHK